MLSLVVLKPCLPPNTSLKCFCESLDDKRNDKFSIASHHFVDEDVVVEICSNKTPSIANKFVKKRQKYGIISLCHLCNLDQTIAEQLVNRDENGSSIIQFS